MLVRATGIPDAEALTLMRESHRLDAIDAVAVAQGIMNKQYDNKHQKPNFSSGFAYVRLSGKTNLGYSLRGAASSKLAAQRSDPYWIVRSIANGLAYELDLHGFLKDVHPVISVRHLEPAPRGDDPFERPPPPRGDPRATDVDGSFKILDIVGHRVGGTTRRPYVEYLVP